ncbi:19496_t:CDS:2, partial [Racocetra fulgida]
LINLLKEFIEEMDSNKSSDSKESVQDDNISDKENQTPATTVLKGLNPSIKVLNLQQKISTDIKSVEILGTIKRIAR